MHTQAEGKLKAGRKDGKRPAGAARPRRAQIQPRPTVYHMWFSQCWYGMTWPARIA
jgi:hypothetical protein